MKISDMKNFSSDELKKIKSMIENELTERKLPKKLENPDWKELEAFIEKKN
jgi:hypothetical protein